MVVALGGAIPSCKVYVFLIKAVFKVKNILCAAVDKGTRAGASGCGTALHAVKSWVRFPIVSSEFYIDIILPAAL
jgi:hypothetical protein